MIPLFNCKQEIPCNPCETSCPIGMISIGDDISKMPQSLEGKNCVNCGRCVAVCPGLAIRLYEEHHSDTTSLLGIPYEFLPLPVVESQVPLLDAQGQHCGEGKIHGITKPFKDDPTVVVYVEVEKNIATSIYMIGIGSED